MIWREFSRCVEYACAVRALFTSVCLFVTASPEAEVSAGFTTVADALRAPGVRVELVTKALS